MDEVDGGGEVATEAVAGDGEALALKQGWITFQFGVPRLPVGQLPEGKAAVVDLQLVRRFVVRRSLVDEFGGAEGENEFARICLVADEGAAAAGCGVGQLRGWQGCSAPCAVNGRFGRPPGVPN